MSIPAYLLTGLCDIYRTFGAALPLFSAVPCHLVPAFAGGRARIRLRLTARCSSASLQLGVCSSDSTAGDGLADMVSTDTRAGTSRGVGRCCVPVITRFLPQC